MNYNLTTPCPHCPFRTDLSYGAFPLDRADEIAEGLLNNQTFSCHATTTEKGRDNNHPKASHCAGALIVLEKIEQPHQMMRIAERLGMYDRHKLDMEAAVYDDLETFSEECMAAANGKKGSN